MSVSSHLNLNPDEYDAKIRTLIPFYEELLENSSQALQLASRKVETIVELGIGTGGLTHFCLQQLPKAKVWAVDADNSMLDMLDARLGKLRKNVSVHQDYFAAAKLPECDAIVSSYALHHIRERKEKQAFYRKCFRALRPGGVLINGDCAPSSTATAFAADLEIWYCHLAKTFGRAKGKRVYASWADEDFYYPLQDETQMLERAGFAFEIPWRKGPFAVMVGVKL